MRINVQGGSGGGSRQPLKEIPRESWTCSNGHENKPYHTRCLTLGCNVKRPA